ncbi:MAG: YkgJ family cysteine cluster protein [Methanomicrobiales archaeon]|nr:YkgJ family cysteine cluster protein [Methanomicrobiales archaeon]
MPEFGLTTAPPTLVRTIRESGFSCTCCGACCTESEPGSNRVMVGPEEIRQIMDGTGLSFEEIAEPYPERIHDDGRDYTFGWVIHQKENKCIFLSKNRCTIYEFRPWICRTYPFVLDNNQLHTHPCNGLHKKQMTENPHQIALDLIKRQEYEHQDEEKIRKLLMTKTIPTGIPVVIDGEGIKEYHG